MSLATESIQRIERRETHVARLEHQIDQLNEVLIEQCKSAKRFRKQLQQHAATLESMELERIKATNPKPPHLQI